jgi:SAM-dependent methyltransferase
MLSFVATLHSVPLLLRLVRRGWRRHGLLYTLRLAISEVAFDVLHGTQTSLEDPEPAGNSMRREPYESSNPLLLSKLLGRLPEEARNGTFLDYGAGKGRALIIAAHHGFASVIGVELSPERTILAVQNADIATKAGNLPEVQVHQADAADFNVPDTCTVAFFFNPFGPEVMRQVIAHLRMSLCRNPRDLYIVLLYPALLPLFTEANFEPVHLRPGVEAILRLGSLD